MVVTIFNLKGQLVGNSIKSEKALTNSDIINGSTSETLRKNLKKLSIHHPKHKKPSSDKDFGYYLAGLIEGNGHFNKENQLKIALDEKDISLAYFLKSFIQFGQVQKASHPAVYLIISKKEGILKILNLINGKMRTGVALDQVKNNISYEFDWLPLDESPLNKNWWLAGLIDGNGSFQIKIIKSEIRLNLQIHVPARLPFGDSTILKIIHSQFGGAINNSNYESVNNGVAAKFGNYLREYHLLSNKHINYLRWYKVYLMIQENKHLTKEGIDRIIKIKNSMKR